GEQVLRALRQGRFGRAQAGHVRLREPSGQVKTAPNREGLHGRARRKVITNRPAPFAGRRLVAFLAPTHQSKARLPVRSIASVAFVPPRSNCPNWISATLGLLRA